MKTNELRRGNLILTPKDTGGKPFLRSIVQEIKADSIVVDGERSVRIEDCAGIPLDEGWLEKYGYEKNNRGNFFTEYEYEGHCFVLYIGQDANHWVVNLQDYALDSVQLRKIQYVHQLQNLFHSLTGNELKVHSHWPS